MTVLEYVCVHAALLQRFEYVLCVHRVCVLFSQAVFKHAAAMLTPVLILCMVVWFVGLVFVWSATDKYLLDAGQQPLRDNVAMLVENDKLKLATLAASELQTYAPKTYAAAAITGTLVAFVVAAVSILFVRRWTSGMRPLTHVATAATFVFLGLLTLQAWSSFADSRAVAWVCADGVLSAITLAVVLVAGVTETQI